MRTRAAGAGRRGRRRRDSGSLSAWEVDGHVDIEVDENSGEMATGDGDELRRRIVAKKYMNMNQGGSQGRIKEGWRMLAVAKWMRGHLASLVDSFGEEEHEVGFFCFGAVVGSL